MLKSSFVPELKPEVGAWIMAALHQCLWFLEGSTVLPPNSARLPQDRSRHISTWSCSPASWRGRGGSVFIAHAALGGGELLGSPVPVYISSGPSRRTLLSGCLCHLTS